MKMADILRDLAELLDQQEGQSGAELGQDAEQQPDAEEPGLDDNPVMVPPLQQKMELLKKSVGIANTFDSEGPEAGQSDEIGRMKKMAGIMTSSEDNDITG